MKVSTDGGKRWDETLLPTITSDRVSHTYMLR